MMVNRDFCVTLCAILIEEEARLSSGYCLFPGIACFVTRARHLPLPSPRLVTNPLWSPSLA